jgi:hypothetical protein
LAVPLANGAEPENAPAKSGGCCPCCQHKPQPQDESANQSSDDRPFEPEPIRCPCSDRVTILSSAIHKVHIDLALVASLPLVDLSRAVLGPVDEAASLVHPTCYKLHLFKCVWLC